MRFNGFLIHGIAKKKLSGRFNDGRWDTVYVKRYVIKEHFLRVNPCPFVKSIRSLFSLSLSFNMHFVDTQNKRTAL